MSILKDHWTNLLCVILLMVLLSSCDDTFEPMAENDSYFFTMYGYLDATADTQWVRVMPIREGIDQLPSLENVTVEIEHMESGIREKMSDSLFNFGFGAEAWNYWSTMDIEPEQSYRIIAEDADGNISTVQVTIPEDFPTPVITTTLDDDPMEQIFFSASVEGIQNLADISVYYFVSEIYSPIQHVFRYPHRDSAINTGEGSYAITIQHFQDIIDFSRYIHPNFQRARQLFNITHRQLFFASAGDDWVDFSVFDELNIMLPVGVTNNVENGFGYVTGVVSKTIPLKNCYNQNGDFEPCPTEQPGIQ